MTGPVRDFAFNELSNDAIVAGSRSSRIQPLRPWIHLTQNGRPSARFGEAKQFKRGVAVAEQDSLRVRAPQFYLQHSYYSGLENGIARKQAACAPMPLEMMNTSSTSVRKFGARTRAPASSGW
jgi:hypothetical protein